MRLAVEAIQGVALVAMATVAMPAGAQVQTGVKAAASELEVVVVTARKREESLQDVPIAVSTVSGEQMLDTHITRAAEIQNYTVYAAGLGANARQAEAAKSLLAVLTGSDASDAIKSKGMDRP